MDHHHHEVPSLPFPPPPSHHHSHQQPYAPPPAHHHSHHPHPQPQPPHSHGPHPHAQPGHGHAHSHGHPHPHQRPHPRGRQAYNSQQPRPIRRAGFARPFHPLQVCSWILMSFCVIIYFSLCIPFVPDGHEVEKYLFIFLYIAIFVVGFGFYVAVSTSDPYSPTPLLQYSGVGGGEQQREVTAPSMANGELKEGGEGMAGAATSDSSPPAVSSAPANAPPPSSLDSTLPHTDPVTAAAGAATGTSLPVKPSEPHAESINPAYSIPSQQPMPSSPPQQTQEMGAAAPSNFPSASPPTAFAPSAPSAASAPVTATAAGAPRCPVCGAVQNADTKHCYIDGRCVDGFDHHCVYLNLCVGQKNYPLFFAFVTLTTCLLTLQLFVTLWLLAHYNDSPYNNAASDSGLNSPLAWLLLLSIVSVFPALCLFGISTLQCFHCYLIASAQSTYQFIVKRRQMMEERRWQHSQQQRQWQWQQQQMQQRMQRGGAGGGGAEVGGGDPTAPVILLTDRQRAEQAEWMKAQKQRSRTIGSVKQTTASTPSSPSQPLQALPPQNGAVPSESSSNPPFLEVVPGSGVGEQAGLGSTDGAVTVDIHPPVPVTSIVTASAQEYREGDMEPERIQPGLTTDGTAPIIVTTASLAMTDDSRQANLPSS